MTYCFIVYTDQWLYERVVFFCKCVVNHLKKSIQMDFLFKVRLVVLEGVLLLFSSVLPTSIYC